MAGIREWAAEQGIEINAKGPVPRAVKERFWEANPDERPDPEVEVDEVVDTGDPGGQPPAVTSEEPPTGKRRSWFTQRGTQRKPRTPRQVKVIRGRASTEKLWKNGWRGLSQAAGVAGFVPLARVLELQAPVAGALLDKEVRGTALDRVLQPFARMAEKADTLGAIVGLPLMVTAVSVKPELYGVLQEPMLDALVSWMAIAGPEMKRQQEKMERATEQLGYDPRELLNAIFAPPAPDAMSENVDGQPDAA